jgi:hypothetical protein
MLGASAAHFYTVVVVVVVVVFLFLFFFFEHEITAQSPGSGQLFFKKMDQLVIIRSLIIITQ